MGTRRIWARGLIVAGLLGLGTGVVTLIELFKKKTGTINVGILLAFTALLPGVFGAFPVLTVKDIYASGQTNARARSEIERP